MSLQQQQQQTQHFLGRLPMTQECLPFLDHEINEHTLSLSLLGLVKPLGNDGQIRESGLTRSAALR